MSKRFKLKLSRAVPSLQLCRSKILSETKSPISVTYKLSRFHPKALDINYPNLPDPPPSTPNSRRKPARSLGHYLGDISVESPDFVRKGDGNKWPAVKPIPPFIRALSFSDDSFESFCSVSVPGKQSEDDENELEFADEEEEPETSLLYSSRSFSCDSSFDFSYPAKTASDSQNRSNLKARSKNYLKSKTPEVNSPLQSSVLYSSRIFSCDSSFEFSDPAKTANDSENRSNLKARSKNYRKSKAPEVDSPLRSSVLRRMMSCKRGNGKVKESVAVVKESEDPYDDFKRSMLEMILEKQIFEAKDLEELLQCLLRLNSRKYHEVIVNAFSEIWAILFAESPLNIGNSRRQIMV